MLYSEHSTDASLLKTNDLKRDRALQMFHDCIAVLASELKIACEKNHKMRTGNGHEYIVVPRLLFLAAGFQQICRIPVCVVEGVMCASARTNHWTIQSISGS